MNGQAKNVSDNIAVVSGDLSGTQKKKHRMELKQHIQGPKTAFMVVISDIIS